MLSIGLKHPRRKIYLCIVAEIYKHCSNQHNYPLHHIRYYIKCNDNAYNSPLLPLKPLQTSTHNNEEYDSNNCLRSIFTPNYSTKTI